MTQQQLDLLNKALSKLAATDDATYSDTQQHVREATIYIQLALKANGQNQV